jgi:hypothetical protein
MKIPPSHLLPALVVTLLLPLPSRAQASSSPGSPAPAVSAETLAARDAADLTAFERFATDAKARGLTHVSITTGLPPSLWQFDTPGDPYPGWFVNNHSILKIFPPAELQPFVDLDYAHRVQHLIAERGKILQKLGLRGHWNSDEPQTLPEAFFRAYPKLRGPRVDQPNRSRVPRFAPCVDQPETLKLYRDALHAMWTATPVIDSFSFLTSDSGAGFCWVPGLYAGINGHSDCKDRPMADRVAGFMKNFQEAANAFHLTVSISINPISPRQWMTPSFSPEVLASIVKELPRGMAVSGHEGPDGRPFKGVPRTGYTALGGPFYPVIGLPPDAVPSRRARSTAGNVIERAQAQRAAAVKDVGEDLADEFVTLQDALAEAQVRLDALNFGAMLRFGHVLARWINRPMVPFPEELKPAEKDYYRKYLFQARSEAQADNLVDIQGMLMYRGWGAKQLFQRVIETTLPDMNRALAAARHIAERAPDKKLRHAWHNHGLRIEAVICLLRSADNMVAYQAHLDRVRALNLKPEYDPPLGVQSDWARTDMMETARKEIDNTVHLMELIKECDEPIIDLAPTPAEEYDMRLGPNLVQQLQRKIDTMNAHWRDYDRIFTVPNL